MPRMGFEPTIPWRYPSQTSPFFLNVQDKMGCSSVLARCRPLPSWRPFQAFDRARAGRSRNMFSMASKSLIVSSEGVWWFRYPSLLEWGKINFPSLMAQPFSFRGSTTFGRLRAKRVYSHRTPHIGRSKLYRRGGRFRLASSSPSRARPLVTL